MFAAASSGNRDEVSGRGRHVCLKSKLAHMRCNTRSGFEGGNTAKQGHTRQRNGYGKFISTPLGPMFGMTERTRRGGGGAKTRTPQEEAESGIVP